LFQLAEAQEVKNQLENELLKLKAESERWKLEAASSKSQLAAQLESTSEFIALGDSLEKEIQKYRDEAEICKLETVDVKEQLNKKIQQCNQLEQDLKHEHCHTVSIGLLNVLSDSNILRIISKDYAYMPGTSTDQESFINTLVVEGQ